MSEIEDLKILVESYGLKFTNKSNGHIQISNHGILFNYYPSSKNRTVHVLNGKVTKHCSHYDAIEICMRNGKPGLRPKNKHIKENKIHGSARPRQTNPSGIKNLYTGALPPWAFPTHIMCQPDILRIKAKRLLDAADHMESSLTY